MINLNNILVKFSAVLLVACIQTSGLLAMDAPSDLSEDQGKKRKFSCLASPSAPIKNSIVMTIRFRKKIFRNNLFSNTFSQAFSDQEEAHGWFNRMVSSAGMKLEVEQFNEETTKKNNAKKKK